MYATVTLTGTYLLPDATPAQGTIEIIPSEKVIVDATGDVILAGRVKVKLDETGSFSVALPATDDPNLNPTGFGYTVSAKLHHTSVKAVSFSLPAAVPVVDVADVTQVDPSTFTPGVTYATAEQLSVKANAADVDAALALKANASSLAAKADATRVDSLETLTNTGRLSDASQKATFAALPDVSGYADGDALGIIIDSTQPLGFRWGPVTSTPPGPALPTVADLANGTIIAHRGGYMRYPENTREAFTACAAAGIPIELDTKRTSDGVLVINHDTTADRTTNLTGNISAINASAWDGAVVDAGAWFNPMWGNLETLRLSDVLAEFGGTSILLPEVGTQQDADDLVAAVVAAGLQDSVIIQAWIQSYFTSALAAGIECMLIADVGTGYTPSAVKAAGINYVGIKGVATSGSVAAAADITANVAAGLKVAVYSCTTHAERDYFINTLGCWAVMSADPVYFLDPAEYRATTDPFASQTFYHGQHAGQGATGTVPARGAFTSPDYLTISGSGGSDEFHINQGWGSPVVNPTGTYTIDFTMKVDAVSATDRWGGIVVCGNTDRGPKRPAGATGYPGGYGYHCLIRATGALAIYKVADGGGTLVAGPSASPVAIPAGTEVPFRVTVTPTTVKVERLDNGHSVTATDSTTRGGYFFLGKATENTIAVSYKNVTVA